MNVQAHNPEYVFRVQVHSSWGFNTTLYSVILRTSDKTIVVHVLGRAAITLKTTHYEIAAALSLVGVQSQLVSLWSWESYKKVENTPRHPNNLGKLPPHLLFRSLLDKHIFPAVGAVSNIWCALVKLFILSISGGNIVVVALERTLCGISSQLLECYPTPSLLHWELGSQPGRS